MVRKIGNIKIKKIFLLSSFLFFSPLNTLSELFEFETKTEISLTLDFFPTLFVLFAVTLFVLSKFCKQSRTFKNLKNLRNFIVTNPSEIIQNQTCCICLEKFENHLNNPIVKLCNKKHIFHLKCLKKWFEEKLECPLCKQNLEKMIESKL